MSDIICFLVFVFWLSGAAVVWQRSASIPHAVIWPLDMGQDWIDSKYPAKVVSP